MTPLTDHLIIIWNVALVTFFYRGYDIFYLQYALCHIGYTMLHWLHSK